MKTKKILRIVLLLLIILDVITMLPWIAFLVVGGFIPLIATIFILLLHIKAYRELGKDIAVPKREIIYQAIAGIVIASSVSLVSLSFYSLSEGEAKGYISLPMQLLYFFSVFFALTTPFFIVFFLNRRLSKSLVANPMNSAAIQPQPKLSPNIPDGTKTIPPPPPVT